MQPQIKTLTPKKLIGFNTTMSLTQNTTGLLWQRFMQRRKEVQNAVGTDLYSLQIYDEKLDFKDFDLSTLFVKWATVEVANFSMIPAEMETLDLPAGLYAVFLYKGRPSDFGPTFNYIFNEWLPASEYTLDNRPHFEILGAKYKNNDPESEEEIWVPVKKK